MYSKQQKKYIESVGGDAHLTAIEIIGELEKEINKTKREHKSLINIKSLAVEAYSRFVDYEMDADTDPPHDHQDFMRRLKKYLAT